MTELESASSGDSTPSTPAASAPPARRLPIEFSATGGEYFRIWIVNLLLTLLTLGIFSAWAKVRRLRYFYGNASLDGASFDYHGKPIQILKGRLVVFGAYAVFYVGSQIQPLLGFFFFPLILVAVPWIIVKSRRFQMRMTSYRGLRLGFDGTYGGAMKAFIGWPMLVPFTLGLLWPRSVWEQANFILASSRYGSERARFETPREAFRRFCFVTMGASAALYVGAIFAFIALFERSKAVEDAMPQLALIALGGVLGLFALLGLMMISAYYVRSYTNAVFGGLALGPHRFESSLETLPLFGIYLSNFALIVLSLGLYTPWARIRQIRYQLAHLHLVASGDLDQFAAASSDGTDALGEEIGDFFDLDFGL